MYPLLQQIKKTCCYLRSEMAEEVIAGTVDNKLRFHAFHITVFAKAVIRLSNFDFFLIFFSVI